MTLPRERINAIKKTREFLRDLLDPKKTPRIPKAIREQAYWCLRHYPGDLYLELNPPDDGSPSVFNKKASR